MFPSLKQFPALSLILLTLFLLPVSFLKAAETPLTKEQMGPPAIDIYLKKVDKKFDKGAANFVAGWTEIVHQPLRQLKNEEKKNKALKVTEGLGLGILFGVTDMVGGFFNAVTSPLLPRSEVPLPQGGVQIKSMTEAR